MTLAAVLYLIVMVLLISAAWAGLSAAPWVPLKRKDIARMVELAQIKTGDKVYDLGCGDGRLVFASARAGANAIGIEMFILVYLYAKTKSFFVPGSRIIFGNFFRHDLSDADAIFVFLMIKAYPKLIKKLEQELKSGCKIIVYCWPIEQWRDKLIIIDKPNNIKLPIYVYQFN